MTLPKHYSQGTAATSKQAHAGTNHLTQRHGVLAWWAEQAEGATLREAADAVEWKGHQIAYSAISARFEELRAEGRLRRVDFIHPDRMGRQRRNPSGRMAYVYQATPMDGAARAVAAVEYRQQVELERGQQCPTCRGRGYIRHEVAEHAVQPKLWG
jgi:hypothetical protein